MKHLIAPAIIVAAGSGVRMKTTMRKQYLLLQDRPILAHTLSVFQKSTSISRIYLVTPEKDYDFIRQKILNFCSKNKEVVLGEIIATIQKEQNEIIRDTPWHSVIVRGVAGSGKTTVAMHRISYILYNYSMMMPGS